MNRTIRSSILGAVLLAAAIRNPPAIAAPAPISSTATMAVTATVTGYCSLSTTPLSFGNVIYQTTSTATAALTYACASGGNAPTLVYTSSAGGGTGSPTMLSNLLKPLTYSLYEPDGVTPLTATGPVVPLGTAGIVVDGNPHTVTIYGKVTTPVTTTPAAFSDTLTFTISS